MILEIFAAVFLLGAAVAFIEDVILPWARRVFNAIDNAISSVIYAIKEVLDAVFSVYVEDSYGNVRTQSKRVAFSDLPSDVQNDLRAGRRVKVGVGH